MGSPSHHATEHQEENWQRLVRLLRDPKCAGRHDLMADAAKMIERLVGYLDKASAPSETAEPASYTAGRQREADARFVRGLKVGTENAAIAEAYEYAADLLSKNTLVAAPASAIAAPATLDKALDLLEMCNTCDLIYSVSHATGIYPDGQEDERDVADLVRAFLKENGRE